MQGAVLHVVHSVKVLDSEEVQDMISLVLYVDAGT